MSAAPMIDLERLQREVVRIHLRYCVEIVEGLGICPWAEEARTRGHVEVMPNFDVLPSTDAALAVIDRMEADPRIEIGLMVFPLTTLERLPFARFVSEVRARDAARKPAGGVVLAMADFHPDAALDMSTPERMVPFVRRSPDPAIQLVRKDALSRVRLSEDQGTNFIDMQHLSLESLLATQPKAPPLSARVAQNNKKTIERLGPAHVRALFDDIFRDRERAYRPLGVPATPWAERALTSDSEA
jgi:hypothetical protein